jgi:pteridine reductase
LRQVLAVIGVEGFDALHSGGAQFAALLALRKGWPKRGQVIEQARPQLGFDAYREQAGGGVTAPDGEGAQTDDEQSAQQVGHDFGECLPLQENGIYGGAEKPRLRDDEQPGECAEQNGDEKRPSVGAAEGDKAAMCRHAGHYNSFMTDLPPLALVTGAAHRLGRAFATLLAQRGYAIMLHYHRASAEAAQTASELQALGAAVYPVRADLTQPAQIDNLFAVMDALPHRLRVLVNSAAVMPRGDARTLTVQDWDAALNLNLRAPLLCSQAAAGRMTEGGLIVNVTDIGAEKAWSRYPAYTVSKAALESLTKVLAKALAPQIRVNAIAPGLVLPSADRPPETWDALVARLPIPRPAQPAEVAAALAYFLDNEYVTGQTARVDGGYSLL